MFKIETGRPSVMCPHGMVAAAHPLAAQAGVHVLKQGGNAIDAAVAVNAVLNVTQPHMCGLGGDLFALIYNSKKRKIYALNGSGCSPYAASLDFFSERGMNTIPTDGLITANVPGCLDAWIEMLDQYGTMPLKQLLEPAIDYAENGFPVSHQLSYYITTFADRLRQFPTSASVMLPNGNPPEPGQTLRQVDLAKTMCIIADCGRECFYHGPIAEEIVRFGKDKGSLLSLEDFKDHQTIWMEPISTNYRGYQIFEHPPNSQGFTLLLELNLIEGFDLVKLGLLTHEYMHLLIEAKKIAFADRDYYNTDPDWKLIPINKLLNKDYASKKRNLINPHRAANPVVYNPHPDTNTTYFCVVDAERNVVSLIQSLFHGFGCGVIAGNTGLFIHNRMSYFSLDPFHPNMLEPHKRTAHTLNPALICKDSDPYIVLGTMGGDGQTQTLLQLISALLDFGLHPQAAIELPRWRSEEGIEVLMENRFSDKDLKGLKAKGHKIHRAENWCQDMGHAHIISCLPNGGLMGAADPRGDGFAIGY